MYRILALTLVLALAPAVAQAGTVTWTANVITYTAASDAGGGENVAVGVEDDVAFVYSERGVTENSDQCEPDMEEPLAVVCTPTPAFIVLLLGFDDTVSPGNLTAGRTLEAHGGAGFDTLVGTP